MRLRWTINGNVLTIKSNNANDVEHVAFGELGDLPKGQLVKREVFFPNMIPNGGGQYNFEFYSNGMPIEQFRLERVAGMPQSTSLCIPWNIRLERYLQIARNNRSTNIPLPIFKGFREFNAQSVKDRGINSLKFVAVVKVDGTIELDKGDPQLTDTELTTLSKDLQNWQFLPAIKNGKPYEMKVSLPVRL